MIVRRLDKNHDWSFGSSLASYAKESEAIAQCVKTALLSFEQDWFLDEEHGIAWFNYFVKNPNVSAMEAEVKRAVLEVEGVPTLNELSLQLDTISRELIITVRYTDIYNIQNTVVSNAPNNR